jgi:hypothetical protein
MPGSPFFVQRCPSCGRQARIDVNYLGLKVICQHCDQTFVARDGSPMARPNEFAVGDNDPANHWIRIADHVLDDSPSPMPAMFFRPRSA